MSDTKRFTSPPVMMSCLKCRTSVHVNTCDAFLRSLTILCYKQHLSCDFDTSCPKTINLKIEQNDRNKTKETEMILMLQLIR